MTILDGIILGILQGFTEFIPVSSSGHLILAQQFLGVQTSAVFDSLINLGTFLALVFYFRKRLWQIFTRLLKGQDIKLVRNLIISALPIVILGIVFKSIIQSSWIQCSWVVAIMLIALGVVMVVLDKMPCASSVKDENDLSITRAFLIGLAQVLALIPGTSRSGSTIIAGKLAGLDYAKAADYSFLLSVPVMFGVVLLSVIGEEERAFIQTNLLLWATSNIAAFICGLIAVKFMLRYLAKGNLKGFGIYRILLALAVITTLIIFG